MDISPELLLLIGKILIVTQVIKRIFDIKWVAALLEKWTGMTGLAGGASMAMAFVVAVVAGALQYGSDGNLSMVDIQEIIKAAVGAIGGFSVVKSIVTGHKPEPVK